MKRIQESRTKVAKVRTTLHTGHMVASLRLLHRCLALRALCGILPYELQRCFLFFLKNRSFRRNVNACSAVEEVAVPGVPAETAEGVGAVFADLESGGEKSAFSYCFSFLFVHFFAILDDRNDRSGVLFVYDTHVLEWYV